MDRSAENACLQGDAPSAKSGFGPFVSFLKPAGEALGTGLLIGLADVANWFNVSIIILSYFLTAAVLGFRHAGRGAWRCWVLLGVSLYLVHVVAISMGMGPPFVEQNLRVARNTLLVFIPVTLGLLIGSSTQFLSHAAGLAPGLEPRFRVLPRSTRDWMEVVLFLGTSIGFVRWVSDLL